jgi:hypothetical protein
MVWGSDRSGKPGKASKYNGLKLGYVRKTCQEGLKGEYSKDSFEGLSKKVRKELSKELSKEVSNDVC